LDGLNQVNTASSWQQTSPSRGHRRQRIEVVINYDLPDDLKTMCTALADRRAGHAGHAISFATPDQRSDISNIERVMNVKLPVASSTPRQVGTIFQTTGRLQFFEILLPPP